METSHEAVVTVGKPAIPFLSISSECRLTAPQRGEVDERREEGSPQGGAKEADRKEEGTEEETDFNASHDEEYTIVNRERIDERGRLQTPRSQRGSSRGSASRGDESARAHRGTRHLGVPGRTGTAGRSDVYENNSLISEEIHHNDAYGAMAYEVPLRKKDKLFVVNMKRFILSSLGAPGIPKVSKYTQIACGKKLAGEDISKLAFFPLQVALEHCSTSSYLSGGL